MPRPSSSHILLLYGILLSSLIQVNGSERRCQRNICLNGGTCIVREDDSFGCRCPRGFGGLICEVDCGCLHGTCDADTASCSCQKGWRGDKCDIEINSVSLPCKRDLDCPSDQRCLEDATGNKMCSVDPCHVTPCRHNGICTVKKGEQICDCEAGFTGRICEEDVNECRDSPCKNGGSCVNQLGGFQCICPAPFSGPICDESVGCHAAPCSGGCVKSASSFRCACVNETLSGRECTPLSTSPCGDCTHGGRCAPLSENDFACLCHPGWSGLACENMNECRVKDRECANGGSCVYGVGGAFCQCSPGFEGEWCERSSNDKANLTDACSGVRCANGGYCIIANGDPKCACPASFTGTWCERRSSPCDNVVCENGGTCEAVGDAQEDTFECHCSRGFAGTFCEDFVESFQTGASPVSPLDKVPPTNSPNFATSTVFSVVTNTLSQVPAVTITTPLTIPGEVENTTTGNLVAFTAFLSTSTSIPFGFQNQEKETSSSPRGHFSTLTTPTRSTPSLLSTPRKTLEIISDPASCSALSCTSGKSCLRRSSLSSHSIFCGCPIGLTGSSCLSSTSVTFDRESHFVHQSPFVMIGSTSGPLSYSLSMSLRTTVPTLHILSGEDLFGQRLYSLLLEEGRLVLNISSCTFPVIPHPVNDATWYTIQLNKTNKDLLISVREESGRLLLSRSFPRPPAFDVFSTRLGKISSSMFFVGCVADFVIDGELRELSGSQRSFAVKKDCTRPSPCLPSPCQENGVCVDLWDSFRCECASPHLPPLCEHFLPPTTLGRNNQSSYAHLAISPDVAETLKYDSSLSLLLRTSRRDSVIAVLGERVEDEHEAGDLATFLSLEIINGTLHARARVGRKAIVDVNTDTRVGDNQQHTVVLTRHHSAISISIDGIERGEATLDRRFDYPLFTDSLLIGTANGSSKGAFTTQEYFKGSLQDIRVNDLSAILHPADFEVRPLGRLEHSQNLVEGLVSDDLCSSLSPCVNGTCKNIFNSWECVCEKGWLGQRCDYTDNCEEASCQKGARCHSLPEGYICVAPAHFVDASFADFSIPNSIPVEKLQFNIRTHSTHVHVLSLESSYMISLSGGQLSLGPPGSLYHLPYTISDGKWKNVTITKNVVRINNKIFGIPSSSSLSTLISTLRIGSLSTLPSFWGCIDSIAIESLPPLSFSALPLSLNVSSMENILWISTKRHKLHSSGCLSMPQCGLADACENGATCEDAWNRRVCHCQPGYTGDHCELEDNECAVTFCQHGHCIDRLGKAECVCKPGYTGASCSVGISACLSSPCLNEGECLPSPVENTSFLCKCKPGFSGRTCALRGSLECNQANCGHEGICSAGPSGFSCACVKGWSGEHCEIPPSPCLRDSPEGGSICGVHGICTPVNATAGFLCQCLPGYTGAKCESLIDSCSSSSCSSHGKCSAAYRGTVCECILPFTGRSCSRRAGGCALVPCENDGLCIEGGDGSTSCRCPEYYLGEGCEVAGSCLESPCVHGKCVQQTPTAHSCTCEAGWKGETCETEVDMCESSPCANGATCVSHRGTFECHCVKGFGGIRCDVDLDECASSPCQNGGRCIDRVADFLCECSPAFSGRNCEIDVDECAIPGSCIHGKCTNTHGSFLCACEAGYLGSHCSLRDPCLEDPSNPTGRICVHGECTRAQARKEGKREWVEHECKCEHGYTGVTCAIKREEGRLSLGYILGPVLVILVVLCLLGCTLLLFVLKGKRALHGHYSPSHQEIVGSRMHPLGTMMKLPPEERLI